MSGKEARLTTFAIKFKDEASKNIEAVNKKYDEFSNTVIGKSKKISDGVVGVGKGIQGIGGKLDNLAGKFTLLSGAAAGGIGAAIKMGNEYNEVMDLAQANMDETKENMEELNDFIFGLDKRASSKEYADFVGVYASSGYDIDEIKDKLQTTEWLTDLGVSPEAAAAGIATADKAFKVEAEKAGNIYAKAQASAYMTAEETMGVAATGASAFVGAGMGLEDAAVMAGVLADLELKGNQAGAAVNSFYNDIVAKSEDGVLSLGDVAVAVYDANGEMRNLIDIALDVDEATKDMDESQRNLALSTIFTANSQKVMTAMQLGGIERIKELEEAIHGVEDTALEDMSKIATDNLSGDFKKLKTTISDTAIMIKETLDPSIREIVQKATKYVQKIKDMPEESKEKIGKIVLAIAALAPALKIAGKAFGFIGKVVEGFGLGLFKVVKGAVKVVSIFGKIGGVIKGVGSALFAASPVGAIVAGVGIAIAVGTLLYKKSETFRDLMNGIFGWLKDKALWILEGVKKVGGGVINVVEWMGENVKEGFSFVFSLPGKLFEIGKDIVVLFATATAEFGLGLIEKAKENLGKFKDAIFGIPSAVGEAGKKIVNSFTDSMKNFGASAIERAEKVRSSLSDKWLKIKTLNGRIGSAEDKEKVNDNKAGHRTGLDYIPKDDYSFLGHKGEMILTRSAAEKYRKLGGTKDTVPNFKAAGEKEDESIGQMIYSQIMKLKSLSEDVGIYKNSRKSKDSNLNIQDSNALKSEGNQGRNVGGKSIVFNPTINVKVEQKDGESNEDLEGRIYKKSEGAVDDYFRKILPLL